MSTKTKIGIAAVGIAAAVVGATISAPIDDAKMHEEAKTFYREEIEKKGAVDVMAMFGKGKKDFVKTLDDEVKSKGGATLKNFSSDEFVPALETLLK